MKWVSVGVFVGLVVVVDAVRHAWAMPRIVAEASARSRNEMLEMIELSKIMRGEIPAR